MYPAPAGRAVRHHAPLPASRHLERPSRRRCSHGPYGGDV